MAKRNGGVGRHSSAFANADRKFVEAAKNGDSVAFGILCTQSAGMVLNIARRIVPTSEDAEDVVQQSFQLAFTHLKNFKGDSRFSTWLTRIVTNAALMRLRKINVGRELPLDESSESQLPISRFDVEDQSLNPEQLYAQKERYRMLRRAVNGLDPGMRRAIELREIDERSTEETARMMGISVSAVKARVFHGRRKLRRLLNRMSSIPICDNKRLRLTQNSALRRQVSTQNGQMEITSKTDQREGRAQRREGETHDRESKAWMKLLTTVL